MKDQRKTKKQLLEDLALAQERIELEQARSLALQEVSNQVAGAHDTDEVLDLIVNEAARLVGATTVFIRLLERDSLVLRAATWGPLNYELPPDYNAEEGMNSPAHVMTTKKPLFGEEVARLIRPDNLRTIEKQGGDPAAAGVVPLLANDQSIGTLSIADFERVGRRFKEDEIA